MDNKKLKEINLIYSDGTEETVKEKAMIMTVKKEDGELELNTLFMKDCTRYELRMYLMGLSELASRMGIIDEFGEE